jgi:hypothetical protein
MTVLGPAAALLAGLGEIEPERINAAEILEDHGGDLVEGAP